MPSSAAIVLYSAGESLVHRLLVGWLAGPLRLVGEARIVTAVGPGLVYQQLRLRGVLA